MFRFISGKWLIYHIYNEIEKSWKKSIRRIHINQTIAILSHGKQRWIRQVTSVINQNEPRTMFVVMHNTIRTALVISLICTSIKPKWTNYMWSLCSISCYCQVQWTEHVIMDTSGKHKITQYYNCILT